MYDVFDFIQDAGESGRVLVHCSQVGLQWRLEGGGSGGWAWSRVTCQQAAEAPGSMLGGQCGQSSSPSSWPLLPMSAPTVQGVSRSASLAIAYLMWKQGTGYDETFSAVKARRGVANPNIGFICQVGGAVS